MFKVVADQLKISQGWVRCGHCSEVFDAAANLQPYVPQGAVTSPAASTGAGSQEAQEEQGTQEEPGTAASVATMLVAPSADTERVAQEESADGLSLSLPEVQVSPSPDLAADVFAFSVSPEPSGFADMAPPEERTAHTDSAFGASQAPAADTAHEVSFVREARREAFWRQRGVRVFLVLAAFVLLAVFLLQIAVFQRNTLAAWRPALGPGLQTLCAYLQCEVKAPQQIESIVIDSSAFNKLAADSYRLRVVIKNAGTLALAMPFLELTLTDSQEQALLRRVLTPAELGATAATLAAGAEFSGAVAIQISNSASTSTPAAGEASAPVPQLPALRISGYRVLAFYP